jgi:Pectate lyase superfamily protein
MANIPVIAEINTLLDANDVTIAKAALGVLGAVTTGGALGTPTSGTLTNATDLPIVAGTSGTLTVARGGTGTTTPAIVAGTNVTVTGSWPNQTINAASGGTPAFSAITGQPTDNANLATALNAKQATLSSGTNIKSVNGTTLLGSGDVAVTGSDVINVMAAPYNAVGDGRLIDTYLNSSGVATQGASMTSGSATVTVAGGTFTAGNMPTGDVGKYICIQGVGTSPTGTIYASPATTKSIASAAQANNVVTLTFASAHGFTTGDVIDVTGITGSPSPNGRYTVASTPLATTLTYALSGSAGTYTVSSATATGGIVSNVVLSTTGSVGAYPASTTIDFEVESLGTATPPTDNTNNLNVVSITNPIPASQSNGVVTLIFNSPHGFTTGDLVDVSGITGYTGPNPNGRFTITVTSVAQITYALAGSAGTYGVSSAAAIGVAIAGINGVLRMTTDNSGQASALTIVNGGSLYANPKLVFPETGLIGTIATYLTSTSVTISRVAPSAFTNKPCFFGTDNTAAIQAALDAALASTTIKTVYIPTGIFLCNIKTYTDINLIGAGGGIGTANNLTFAGQTAVNRSQDNATVLMPAVGYKPVIYSAVGGGSVSRMFIQGTSSLMNNTGLKLGTSYGTGFVSLGFILKQVNFSGFKYALAAARIADSTLENVTASYCGIMFYLTQPDEIHYTDQTTIIGCYGNYIRDYFVYCVGGKSVQLISCDYTNSGSIAKIKSGTRLTIIGMNLESSPISYPSGAVQPNTDLIEAIGGASVIINSLRLSLANGWTDGAVIKEDTNRTNAAGIISVLSSDSGGSGLYRTNSAKYPNLLPKGAVISRWDSGFTTKIMSEVSTRAYAGAGKMGRFKSWSEYFPTPPPYNKMVTGAVSTAGVVTLTTVQSHGLVAGMYVNVDNISYATTNPNGIFLVSTATTTTITYALTGGGNETFTTDGSSFVTNEGLGFQNGFCLTNFGATTITKPLDTRNNNGKGIGIKNGQFYISSSSNPAYTGVRLAQEYGNIYPTESWELKFDVQSDLLYAYPIIRLGMYALTSSTAFANTNTGNTTASLLNGVGINIINPAVAEPNIFLESVVNGIVTSVDCGFKLSNARRVIVLTKYASQITLSVHTSAASGYAPIGQKVWSFTPPNTGLYYSPSIYLGNSNTSTAQEMLVNSIKYQEINADLM